MKKIISCIFIISLVTFLFGVINSESKQTSKEEAIEIANKTEEVKEFLKFYGKCDGCVSTYSVGKTTLIGCVEYTTIFMCDSKSAKSDKSSCAWQIEYWVSDACSFRYPNGNKTRITIAIDANSGMILAKNPKLEYIKDVRYCQSDDDCVCLSGSGVRFLGCNNFIHGPTHFAGYYKCEKCKCINNSCAMAMPTGYISLKGTITRGKGGCYFSPDRSQDIAYSIYLGRKVLGEDCDKKDITFSGKNVIVGGIIECSGGYQPSSVSAMNPASPQQMASPFCTIKNPEIKFIK